MWFGLITWLLAGILTVIAGMMFVPAFLQTPPKYIVREAQGLRLGGESRVVAPQAALAAGSVIETGMLPLDWATIDLDGRGELGLRPLSRVTLAESGSTHVVMQGVVGVRASVGTTLTVEAPRLGRLEISGLAWLSIGEHASEAVVLEGSAVVLGRRLGACTSFIVDDRDRGVVKNMDLEQLGKVWLDRAFLANARMGKRIPVSATDDAALVLQAGMAGIQAAQGQATSVPFGLVGESGRFQFEIGATSLSENGFSLGIGDPLDLEAAIGDVDWPQFGQHINFQLRPGNAKSQATGRLSGWIRRVGWNEHGPIQLLEVKQGGTDVAVVFLQNDPYILTLLVKGRTTAELRSYSFSGSLGQLQSPTP